MHTRLTKRQYKAWQAVVKTKAPMKESDILRSLVEQEIKTLSVDDLLKTMEIELKPKKK